MDLNLNANINDPDGFYDELLEVHQGHKKPDSDALNARVLLLLFNHIVDREVLRQFLEAAK